MNEQYLVEIELPFWQDPQGDLIMEKSRDYCRLYCGCWDEQNPPDYAIYIGRIEFVDAWAVRSMDVEFYDVYTKEEGRELIKVQPVDMRTSLK
ncbi:MAG: hypothetical protein ICV83_01390, partial [Cytophagales bacterium]|nr:hypothetical protein [Cytophagales bacterium]